MGQWIAWKACAMLDQAMNSLGREADSYCSTGRPTVGGRVDSTVCCGRCGPGVEGLMRGAALTTQLTVLKGRPLCARAVGTGHWARP